MLELNLRAHAPAFAEIVTHINHHVRQVELAVVVIGVLLRILAVPEVIIGVETMFGCHLAVSADGKPSFAFLLRLCLITHYLLGFCRIGRLNGRLLFQPFYALNQCLQIRGTDLDTIFGMYA